MNNLTSMKKEFFICQCNNTEHQLVFNYFEDELGGDVYVEVHLVPTSFWKRIRTLSNIFSDTDLVVEILANLYLKKKMLINYK